MTNLRDNIQDTHTINAARVFIILLYDQKMNQTTLEITLDDLRFHLASASDKALAKLPPAENAFLQHILRFKIQLQIWLNIHDPKASLLSPVNNGWECSRWFFKTSYDDSTPYTRITKKYDLSVL